jgi:hypothetical protein
MSEWISVNDRLPQVDFEVLVSCDGDVTISNFRVNCENGAMWFDIECENGWIVTHWMPVPEPPTKDKD